MEADDAAMDEAEVCLARKQEHYHMAADDSDPGSIDAEVYEYAYNGGVMGYHDTAQELELSVEYPAARQNGRRCPAHSDLMCGCYYPNSCDDVGQ